MNSVHHVFHVDRGIIETQLGFALRSRYTPLYIRRIRVVARRANFGIATTVIAVQGQVLVTIIALADVDNLASGVRRRVGDCERQRR